MRQILLLIVLAFAATAAQAQTVFRSVMPDGSVVYGDKPAPDAKEAKQITLPPSNVLTAPRQPAPTSKPASPSTPAPAAAPKKPAAASPDALLVTAEEELRTARAALEAGRNEKEGERIHLKGGGTRLTDAHFERIKSLEAAVAAAQKKLEDAYAKRNAAR